MFSSVYIVVIFYVHKCVFVVDTSFKYFVDEIFFAFCFYYNRCSLVLNPHTHTEMTLGHSLNSTICRPKWCSRILPILGVDVIWFVKNDQPLKRNKCKKTCQMLDFKMSFYDGLYTFLACYDSLHSVLISISTGHFGFFRRFNRKHNSELRILPTKSVRTTEVTIKLWAGYQMNVPIGISFQAAIAK